LLPKARLVDRKYTFSHKNIEMKRVYSEKNSAAFLISPRTFPYSSLNSLPFKRSSRNDNYERKGVNIMED